MDKTLDTRLDLYESTVIGDENDFTLNLVTDLEVRIESIPRMNRKLLETEGDSLLGLIEVEDNDIDLLVEVNNLFSQDYDVILNYPMPKRNYRVTLTFEI